MAVIHIRGLLNCFGTILTTPRIVSALLGRVGLYLVVQLQGRAVRLIGTILTTPRIVSALLGRVSLYLVVRLQGRTVRLIREVYYFHGLCLHSGSMWSWNSLCLLT